MTALLIADALAIVAIFAVALVAFRRYRRDPYADFPAGNGGPERVRRPPHFQTSEKRPRAADTAGAMTKRS